MPSTPCVYVLELHEGVFSLLMLNHPCQDNIRRLSPCPNLPELHLLTAVRTSSDGLEMFRRAGKHRAGVMVAERKQNALEINDRQATSKIPYEKLLSISPAAHLFPVHFTFANLQSSQSRTCSC
jgi:hypothetical protein